MNDGISDDVNHGNFDMEAVEDCRSMFEGCVKFNQMVSGEFRYVRDMSRMFYGATSFNKDVTCLSTNCRDFSHMFYNATAFNGGLIVNKNSTFYHPNEDETLNHGVDLSYMFFNARSFNQDISGWNVSLCNMKNMFNGAVSFNQNLNSWDLRYEIPFNTRELDGIFQNCKALDFEVTGWLSKFGSPYDFNIYHYFAGADFMIERFFRWEGEEVDSDANSEES